MKYFDLSQDLGLIQIQGQDSLKFLQGLLTCDIQLLEDQDYLLGAFCNLKGRIRALFKIFKSDNGVLLQVPIGLITSILPALKKHAMFSKITINDVSKQYQQWGYLTQEKRSIKLFPIESNISDPFPTANNTEMGDFNEWVLLDIREEIPEIWPETTEQFLPHYLNLPKLGAVSFTKGCYCGQEIVARMEYKAKIKYELNHIVAKNHETLDPNTTLKIGAESEFGTIVSRARNEEGDFELLVVSPI